MLRSIRSLFASIFMSLGLWPTRKIKIPEKLVEKSLKDFTIPAYFFVEYFNDQNQPVCHLTLTSDPNSSQESFILSGYSRHGIQSGRVYEIVPIPPIPMNILTIQLFKPDNAQGVPMG